MFDSVEDAGQAFRDAAAAHHGARDRGDTTGMDAAAEHIRGIVEFLHAGRHSHLVFPLTMEWATAGRDDTEHACYRAQVAALLAAEGPS